MVSKTKTLVLSLMGLFQLILAQGTNGDAADAGAIPTITAAALRDTLMANQQAVVLDVRTAAEFTGPLGHIDGARLIPVQVLDQRLAELDSLKGQPIYVICRSGNRSKTATRILREHQFEAVNISGGMRAWNRLPVATEPTQDLKE
ncbi:MAG: rhodanese-like domain-containing protein [Candidatus Marinimicrobia bacterium]|nr:rhodanese-like domain-containing protein [Candidatus Neomarinimicrobiota bacterium]